MARLTDFEKKRLAKCYSSSLFKLYEEGKISDNEMEIVIRDILLLKKLFSSFDWKRLEKDHRMKIIREYFPKLSEVFSPVTLIWIKLHLPEKRIAKDKLDESINMIYGMDHFPILESSIKEVEKNVITIYVDIPDYIDLTDERKNKLDQVFKTYFSGNNIDQAQKRKIAEIMKNMPISVTVKEKTYQDIYNTYFRHLKSKFVKIYISQSKHDPMIAGFDLDEEFQSTANHVFDYKLHLFRKKIFEKKSGFD